MTDQPSRPNRALARHLQDQDDAALTAEDRLRQLRSRRAAAALAVATILSAGNLRSALGHLDEFDRLGQEIDALLGDLRAEQDGADR